MEWRKFILFLFLGFLILVFVIKEVKTSVFLKNQDRVNIIFYSSSPKFLSFSKKNLNYLINFLPTTQILVPGGYQYYKIGALGKLVNLEKKPDLFKKAFSGGMMAFVDLYFYPKTSEVYYQSEKQIIFPKIWQIFSSNSSANFLDRLLLSYKLLTENKTNYQIINIDDEKIDQQDFIKKFQGNFYKDIYRELQETVQIFYKKSYSTAQFISNIITGEGIRVVDISYQDNKKDNDCLVITKKKTVTSLSIAQYFGCQIQIGETDISDIILKLGKLEDNWAIK